MTNNSDLSKEQKEKILKFAKRFGSESGESWAEEISKESYFKNIKKKEIETLDEFKLLEMLSKLWGMSIWGNKEHYVKKIVAENGMKKIRNVMKKIFFGKEKEGKYEYAVDSIKYLGPAMVTELLCRSNPEKYGIWNNKARGALKILGFQETLPLDKYKIKEDEYQNFNRILNAIASEIESTKLGEKQKVNLLFVDHFLYEVWKESVSGPQVTSVETQDFDHDEVRDMVRDIGAWLGFDADTEKVVSRGAQVDVIWRSRIANLGTVNYVFEVQKSGSWKSLIINFIKASNNPTVQKLVIVSDAKQIEKIKEDVSDIKDLKGKISFWDVSEVMRTRDLLEEVFNNIQKLDLVNELP